MSVGTDTVAAILSDISRGVQKSRSKIPLNTEASALWDKLQKEITTAPPGTAIDVPTDGNDDQYLGHLYRN